jgi:hypothetical protein
MRVERGELPKLFEPVHLILETQEEVDLVFSVFSFTPITEALNDSLNCLAYRIYEELHRYHSCGYDRFMNYLRKNLTRR